VASWDCPNCQLKWPARSEFNDCPHCGAITKANRQGEPMTEQEARRQVGFAKFEEWCVENHRTETDPPAECKVFLPSGHSPHDGRIAFHMLGLLEDLGQVPELHVCLIGLLPSLNE
jgi:hypothetical protein